MKARWAKVLCVLTVILLVSSSLAFAARTYDFGGKTVKISARSDLSANFESGEAKEHLEWVEKTFNVKIEFLIHGTYPTNILPKVLASAMAGEALSDVMIDDTWTLCLLVGNDLVLPLDDVLDEEYFTDLTESFKNYPERFGVYKGKLYAFPQNEFPELWGISWNKTLFEREGLPNVYEFVEEGTWTWDKFAEIAIAATKDRDGDGQIDQWGVADWIDLTLEVKAPMMLPYLWCYTNGITLVEEDENGRAYFALNSPRGYESIQFWRDLAEAEAIIYGGDVAANEFYSGNVAFLVHDNFYRCSENMSDEYGFVPFPKGPNGEDYIFLTTAAFIGCINAKTTHDPRALVELVSAVMKYTEPYGGEDPWDGYWRELYENWVLDEESLRTAEMTAKRWRPTDMVNIDLMYWWGQGGTLLQAIASATSGAKSPQAAMAEVEPVMQENIDYIYND